MGVSMRSEFKEYYTMNNKNSSYIRDGVKAAVISLIKKYFEGLELGSEEWHSVQHLVSKLSSSSFHSSIRTLFYEITMKENCKGKFYCLPNVCFNFPRRIRIGYNVFMNRNVNIVARDDITIGDNVMIGPNTVINSGSHKYENPNMLIRDQGHKKAPIIICNDVFIGGNVFVLPGITIGEGAVIGAGSIVTKNVEPNTVVVGNPARIIKRRCTRNVD